VTAAGLAERSRAAFVERFPNVMTGLQPGETSRASVMTEGGVAVDICVGEQGIYGGAARRFAADQVEAFIKKPLRLFMEQPGSVGLLSDICTSMVSAVKAELTNRGMSKIRRHPSGNPTFLVVFGLGLGYHIMDLVRETKARWLVIVEPTAGFIEHSFQALDWAALLEHFNAEKGEIYLVTEPDPARMVARIVAHVAKHGIPFVDGAWVFTHYPLWSFTEARAKLNDAMQYAFINRGFFEDEIKMMSNAVANFAATPFWLIDGKPRLQRAETAVIVGAGPSLDESLETLHRIRDRVVLFSAGTALRPLLSNGLVPDFQCEIENIPLVVDVLNDTRKYGDLSRIRLIASATVDPRVPPMFRESYFFFRDSVSSSLLLGNKFRALEGAAPTCVNTAMAAAISLGFTDFILFGTDCGVRPGASDHASNTVYGEDGIIKPKPGKMSRFPVEVEGNFGGIVKTDWIYDASRRMLGEAIRVFGLSPINCSDGALIPGARPMVPDAIEVGTPQVAPEVLHADLKRSLLPFEPGEMLVDTDFASMIDGTKSLYGDLREILDAFDAHTADFGGVYQAVWEFLRTAPKEYRNADVMSGGTLIALPRIGMFYGYRIEDGDARRAVFSAYMRETRDVLSRMERETVELFQRLSKMVTVPA
jgi:Glycosyltransferase Maf N-terminal domain/Protein of unknown function DUF115